jgi:phosphatidylserine/phosphatidylglycerophosphate/cardiolipin synthase-like enzyme
MGPAAYDLLRIFVERWMDHPDHTRLDQKKGFLLGDREQVRRQVTGAGAYVQIGRTYGNGVGYEFAPKGEQTARRMILHAIRQARSFIYMEDQYLVSMEVSRALQAALPNIEHLTILIPHGSISDLPQVNYRRREFIAPLKRAGGEKVRVFYLSPAGGPHTYIHAKIYIMDDEFAIIGSANCNRRSLTHDSEVVAGIYQIDPTYSFARELRQRLWQEHLKINTSELGNGVESARFWLSPGRGSPIAAYNENADIDFINTDIMWDNIVDPDGS